MITLITGLPGNGKTLYALDWLRKRAEQEGRPVYYSGVSDLRIPGWLELVDPEQWPTLPKGAILLVDEAQRIFRPRMHGAKVPEFVQALETHRHLGVDLVFITQHPMLVDSNVRRLVGQHFHVIRHFGTQLATIHEWGKCKETCDKNRDDSQARRWKYPQEVFALYKSAELHTHKRRIPFKVLALLSMPIIIGALIYLAWSRISPSNVVPGANSGAPGAPGGAAPGARPVSKFLTAVEYVELQAPRVAGLAYTAPVYDGVTAPVVAPYPAACVTMGERCACYTQQGTVLDTGPVICRQVVQRGFFVAWKQPEQQPVQRPSEASSSGQRIGIDAAGMMAPPSSAPAVSSTRRALANGRSAPAL